MPPILLDLGTLPYQAAFVNSGSANCAERSLAALLHNTICVFIIKILQIFAYNFNRNVTALAQVVTRFSSNLEKKIHSDTFSKSCRSHCPTKSRSAFYWTRINAISHSHRVFRKISILYELRSKLYQFVEVFVFDHFISSASLLPLLSAPAFLALVPLQPYNLFRSILFS